MKFTITGLKIDYAVEKNDQNNHAFVHIQNQNVLKVIDFLNNLDHLKRTA